MMTTLWLVRHGQTDWNVEGRYQGQTDVPLNATGLAQANALAAELAGKPFDAVYSSDLQRARRTAEVIASPLHLAVHTDARLREINQGQWEGQNYRHLVAVFQAEMQARRADPYGFRPPEGESVAEVAARVAQAIAEITAIHPGGQVIIVSHALALATLICRAKNLPLQDVYEHLPHNVHPEVIEWPPASNGRSTILDPAAVG